MTEIKQGFPSPQKNQYLVYVCSNTYNQAPFIEKCLRGVAMQQTDFPYIHHVIDDASTDGQQEIIKDFLNKECDMANAEFFNNDISTITLAKVKSNSNCTLCVYFLKKNMYRNPEKRKLYNLWKDVIKYEAFCEGDDYWTDSQKLSMQVNFLESHPDFALSHTKYLILRQETGKVEQDDDLERIRIQLGDNLSCEDIIRYARIILTMSVVLRTDAVRDLPKQDPFIFNSNNFLLSDIPTWYTAAMHGKVHYHDKVTGVYRVTAGSASHIEGNKNKYLFSVSAMGLRYYLCKRDHLNAILTNNVEIKYANFLFRHWSLNPSYKAVVELDANKYKFMFLCKKLGLLKSYFSIKDTIVKISHIPSHIQRSLTKSGVS